jgi:hypothetical protein
MFLEYRKYGQGLTMASFQNVRNGALLILLLSFLLHILLHIYDFFLHTTRRKKSSSKVTAKYFLGKR